MNDIQNQTRFHPPIDIKLKSTLLWRHKRWIARLLIIAVLPLLSGCFFGGIVVKGGHNSGPEWHAFATQTHGADYQIICELNEHNHKKTDSIKEDKSHQAKSNKTSQRIKKTELAMEKSSHIKGNEKQNKKMDLVTSKTLFRLVNRADYKGGCEQTGQSSVFYLMNFWPLTNRIDPNYAIASAVQRLEGDTMVHIRIWHEVHYYGIVGRVFVFKASGDVIRYTQN